MLAFDSTRALEPAQADSLDLAERKLASVEAELEARASGLDEAIATASRRLATLKAQATELRRAAARPSPDLLTVLHRIGATVVPTLARRELERARRARLDALSVRADAVAKWRERLERCTTALELLTQGLKADERTLEVARGEGQGAVEVDAEPEGRPVLQGRRQSVRVPLRTEVDCAYESHFFTGFSDDLSTGGVFVATWHPLELGTELDLTLELPGTGQLALHGVVRWARPPDDREPLVTPGMGIAFQNLTDGATEAIETFIASREPVFFWE